MDKFEGMKTLKEEIIADIIRIAREQKLIVESKNRVAFAWQHFDR